MQGLCAFSCRSASKATLPLPALLARAMELRYPQPRFVAAASLFTSPAAQGPRRGPHAQWKTLFPPPRHRGDGRDGLLCAGLT